MGGTAPLVTELSLVGGSRCLDFVNSLDWRASDHALDYLTSYGALVAWGEHASILTSTTARHLRAAAERRPEEAATTLRAAVAQRETIWRIFVAIARGEQPPASDLEILNAMLGDALQHARITPSADGSQLFRWDWEERSDELDRPLWPVVRAAADVLTSLDAERVHECPGDGCGWLFLDTSKNRSRRWCAMRGCGNRAKARQHYQRVRGQSDERSQNRVGGKAE
jgi:predicted RNA-binding Zn ribbon-like protein